MSRPRPDRALLIGIDRYFAEEAGGNASLEGAVADALAFEAYLREELGLPAECLELLLSPSAGPVGADRLASCANVHAALARLVDGAERGEQVLFYWSGHGTRTPTAFPDLKGSGGEDACLVPCDAATGGGLLTDVELYWYVSEAVRRGLHPILVLDSCFGLSLALRAGAQPRCYPAEALGKVAAAASPLPRPALLERWRGERVRRDFEALGLRIPRGVVLLAASTREQAAHELARNGTVRGAFTECLLAELPQARGETWYALADRVSSGVQSLVARQCPQVEGESDRLVFECRLGSLALGPRVAGVEPASGRVWLAAGAAQGLERSDLLQVRPREKGGRGVPLELVVDEVLATGCWAVARGPLPAGELTGERAVITALAQPLRVGVLPPLDPEEPWLSLGRLAGRGLFALVPADGQAPFQLGLGAEGGVFLADAAGAPLPHTGPALERHVDSSAELARRLAHLARFHRLWQLQPSPGGPGLAAGARVSVRHRLEEVWSGSPAAGEGPPALTVRPGDSLELSFDGASTALHVAVLGLTRRWAVQQVLPARGARTALVVRRRPVACRVELKPESAAFPGAEQLLILLVEATSSPPDFRWLELPALDPEKRATLPTSEPAPSSTLRGGPQPNQRWGRVRLRLEVAP